MKNRLFVCLAIAGGFVTAPWPAAAHHGWTEFDSTREVTLEGIVTDFHFVNPHCVVEFNVKGEAGQASNWQGEFSNPGQLLRKGWNITSLEAGSRLTITGYPARKDAHAIHVTRIRLENGRELRIQEGK